LGPLFSFRSTRREKSCPLFIEVCADFVRVLAVQIEDRQAVIDEGDRAATHSPSEWGDCAKATAASVNVVPVAVAFLPASPVFEQEGRESRITAKQTVWLSTEASRSPPVTTNREVLRAKVRKGMNANAGLSGK
jgi:hypothetical protein